MSSGGAGDDGLAVGEAAEQRDEGQLVDGQRHLVRLDDRADQRTGGDVELADRLVGDDLPRVRVLEVADDDPAHPLDDAAKPTRVQFALMSVMTIREPRTSTAAAMWKAADDGSPGTWIAPSSSSSCWVREMRPPCA